MVDFPNNPSNGDTHTENGSTWFWQANPGIWALGEGNSVEIARAEFSSSGGWQVWGDALIQWGTSSSDGSGNVAVTFPLAYASGTVPRVNVTLTRQPAGGQPPYVYNGSGGAAGTGGFAGRIADGAGAAQADKDFDWVAIGEAPDNLKMAKEVGAGGGGGGGATITLGDTFPVSALAGALHYLTVQPVGLYVYYDDGDSQQWVQSNGAGAVPGGVEAFHDPAGAASWRLDRDTNTLECWGRATADSNGEAFITFPKQFASQPRCQVTAAQTNSTTRLASAGWQSINGQDIQLRVRQSISGVVSPASGAVDWWVIGEWDGVS